MVLDGRFHDSIALVKEGAVFPGEGDSRRTSSSKFNCDGGTSSAFFRSWTYGVSRAGYFLSMDTT